MTGSLFPLLSNLCNDVPRVLRLWYVLREDEANMKKKGERGRARGRKSIEQEICGYRYFCQKRRRDGKRYSAKQIQRARVAERERERERDLSLSLYLQHPTR
jgi:hypothetical protein